MELKWKKRIGTLILALCLIFSMTPVLADETGKIEVIFTDVTESDLTTLSGEAKIMVSVRGAEGNVSIAQMTLGFSGDLKYKSIQFLTGENNPPECFLYSPNTALANTEHEIMPSIISNDSLAFEEETDLFILTFEGEAGGSVTLNISDTDNTYCTVGGSDLTAQENGGITVSAASEANEGKEAVVKVIMDKVEDFAAGSTEDGYKGSGIELKITSEQTGGYTVYTVLNNTLVSQGGHRESESVPTFTVENTVLAGDTYTVELSGLGYVPYIVNGISFDEALEITNADFIPGDINSDKKVDASDKAECEKAVSDPEYAADLGNAADFNRDGSVDKYDLAVFDGIEDGQDTDDENEVPEKMEEPEVTGGNKKITVKWKKPDAEDITGYVIKYGTSRSDLNKTEEVNDSTADSEEITGLLIDTTYYVQIAAQNEAGTGEFSDIASARTDENSAGGGSGNGGGGGSGNGGGGSSSGGGGGSYTPSNPANPTENTNTEDTNENTNTEFTDLAGYDWAKDAIYELKEKGIINGMSETEFAPGDNIRRGDFILILTRMLDINNEFSENFADVPAGSYYYDAIGSARAAGIAAGDGVNFMPDNSITREDLITLSYRAFFEKGYIEETTDLTPLDAFSDKDLISDYAASPMASMVKAGIIEGSDGGVNPKGNATRAEVAVMCFRLFALMD